MNFIACHLGSKQNWRNPVNYSESSVVCANLCLCFITFQQILILFLSIALLIHEHSHVSEDHFHYCFLLYNFIITSDFNQGILNEKKNYIFTDTIFKTYLPCTKGCLILAIWHLCAFILLKEYENLLVLCFLCTFIWNYYLILCTSCWMQLNI